MGKRVRTSDVHFKIFCDEINYWIDKFQLREWRIKLIHKDPQDPNLKNSFAWISTNCKGRICVIGLSTNWDDYTHDTVPVYEVLKSAFHEACELLLADIKSIAAIDICPTQDWELDKSIHSVIRRMEWVVWEPDLNRRGIST